MITTRSELPPLVGGVLLALAGVGLAAAHVAVPDFVSNGAVLLLGIAGGATVPGRTAAALPPPSSPRPPLTAATPEGQAAICALNAQHSSNRAAAAVDEVTTLADELRALLAKPQAADPTSTPTPAAIVAPGPAEPHAGGLS